jgi:hypothetical protein
MTASSLRAYSIKDLAQMAKRRGLPRWDAMRKDQLVHALLRASAHRPSRVVSKKTAAPTRRAASRPAAVVRKSSRRSRSASTGAASIRRKPRMVKRLEQVKAQMLRSKDLAGNTLNRHFTNGTPSNKDRLVLMVRGPFWLHACWELGSRSIMRAQAAMGQDWHLARPFLRVFNVTNAAASSSSERILRDIPVHGGVRNWYIDVKQAPQTYRVEIGYLTAKGRFYSLARSNTVSTPPATAGDSLDSHWGDIAEDCDKIYALSGGYAAEGNTELQELFEERMRRPMGNAASRYGNGSDGLLPRERLFRCEIDAEIIIHGATQTGAHVMMQGEPVKVQPDGSFHVRLDLPNRRQVIPIVASTKDGVEQRTVVLAVERNTKVMEPVTRESGE